MKVTPTCPGCGKALQAVRQDANSMLNAEQFDAARAGDWFCDVCKGEGARTGYRYFWDRELTPAIAAQTAPAIVPCKQPECRYPICGCVSGGVCLPPLPPSAAWEMPPLDDDLRDILGRPNFTCIGISQRLRELGYSIKHRAEEEQATVIHLLLQHYFANGTAWRDTVQAFLARHKPDADQAAPGGDAISSVHGPDDATQSTQTAHQPSGVPR